MNWRNTGFRPIKDKGVVNKDFKQAYGYPGDMKDGACTAALNKIAMKVVGDLPEEDYEELMADLSDDKKKKV